MFLIRVAFWVGVAVLLLPTDERQQARVYGTAVATVERVTTFCERNAQACAAGAELWSTFVKKAEFGVRMAIDLATSSGRKDEDATPPHGWWQLIGDSGRPQPMVGRTCVGSRCSRYWSRQPTTWR